MISYWNGTVAYCFIILWIFILSHCNTISQFYRLPLVIFCLCIIRSTTTRTHIATLTMILSKLNMGPCRFRWYFELFVLRRSNKSNTLQCKTHSHSRINWKLTTHDSVNIFTKYILPSVWKYFWKEACKHSTTKPTHGEWLICSVTNTPQSRQYKNHVFLVFMRCP